jgi:hypothetical protein
MDLSRATYKDTPTVFRTKSYKEVSVSFVISKCLHPATRERERERVKKMDADILIFLFKLVTTLKFWLNSEKVTDDLHRNLSEFLIAS